MSKSNKKKSQQLGMPHGTANGRLRKMILFDLVKNCKEDTCFRCGEKIVRLHNFSIEHKEHWLDSDHPFELFFDLDNIAFSHIKCNFVSKRVWNKGMKTPHGTKNRYTRHGCRCNLCRSAHTVWKRKQRKKLS